MAIGTGATFAVIILIILTSLIRHKKKPDEYKTKQQLEGNFTLAPSPSDSGISTSSSQKSNLMFRYFGKSLSSFDVENLSTFEMKSNCARSNCVAINIESDDPKQFYRQNILSASGLEKSYDLSNSRYIQTIAC